MCDSAETNIANNLGQKYDENFTVYFIFSIIAR
jgi:hypothetical protein